MKQCTEDNFRLAYIFIFNVGWSDPYEFLFSDKRCTHWVNERIIFTELGQRGWRYCGGGSSITTCVAGVGRGLYCLGSFDRSSNQNPNPYETIHSAPISTSAVPSTLATHDIRVFPPPQYLHPRNTRHLSFASERTVTLHCHRKDP